MTGCLPKAESQPYAIMEEPEPQRSVFETVFLRSWSPSLVIKSEWISGWKFPLTQPLTKRFWGEMIHRAGGGPEPIPQKQLTVDNLADAIKFAVSPEAKAAAGKMGEQIRSEDGEAKGVTSFHRSLPLHNMQLVAHRMALCLADKQVRRVARPCSLLAI